MLGKRTHQILLSFIAFMFILSLPAYAQQHISSTWTGQGSDNKYSNTDNWDPPYHVPPKNFGPFVFDVTIPAGTPRSIIEMDLDECVVGSFVLGEGKTLLLPKDANYTVTEQANISGIIDGKGGHFNALDASFPGKKTQIWAESGSVITLTGNRATQYSSAGLDDSAILMSAKGVGSKLDLSSITNLAAGFNSNKSSSQVHTIMATEGGQVDISGVQTIIAPIDYEDRLNILLNNGAIDFASLRELSSSSSGYTRFELANADTVTLPALEKIAKTVFALTKGAQLSANGDKPISYSSTGFTENATLASAKGAGTLLDLSSITHINGGFNSNKSSSQVHTISATEGAHINLSGVQSVSAPVDSEDSLEIQLDNGFMDLSSLKSIQSGGAGYANIGMDNNSILHTGNLEVRAKLNVSLNGGSVLRTNGLRTTKPTSIALRDPYDLLEVAGDFDMSADTRIFNSGNANLILGGDFAYTHADPKMIPLGKSTVFFVGPGPQEVEVAGLDVMTYPDEFLQDDNFGYGQIVIGQPNEPTAVLLVDNIDNGLRGGFSGPDGEAVEALYLFGKDGLWILGGSTLYLNGLHVYARLNDVATGLYKVTDLYDLFGPDETKIAFDEGWICKGRGPDSEDPANLIENGGFETGVNPPTIENSVRMLVDGSDEIDHWLVAQETMNWTHESVILDAGQGQRSADLSSETGQGAVSQVINTIPGDLYHVWFDLGANPYGNHADDGGEKNLQVTAAGSSDEFSFDATAQVGPDPGEGRFAEAWDVYWQKKTWSFVATDTLTTLTFANTNANPNSTYGVAIDNVVVVNPNWHEDPTRRLNLTIKGFGSVAVQSATVEEDVQGSGEFSSSFEEGEEVTLTAQGEDFARWRGDIGNNDPRSRSIIVVMDNDLSIQADFVDLAVQITNIDTANCPLLQATVLVTDPDANDAPVLDLIKANFSVFEDGIEQSNFSIQQGTCSVAYSLVLDCSGGMLDPINYISPMEEAAIKFVDRMADQDVGGIIKFSSYWEVMQDFTSDKEALKQAIKKNFPGTGHATNLYSTLIKAIADTSEQSGCRAVIILSDGLNAFHDDAKTSKEDVISHAQSTGVPVFTIGLNKNIVGWDILREIADNTGGLFYEAGDSSSQFEEMYLKIANALNNQYTITYEMAGCGPENDASIEHDLEVIVIDDDLSYGLDSESFTCPGTCVSN